MKLTDRRTFGTGAVRSGARLPMARFRPLLRFRSDSRCSRQSLCVPCVHYTAVLMPYPRHSPTAVPPASCTRRVPMACSSVNLDHFMIRPLVWAGLQF